MATAGIPLFHTDQQSHAAASSYLSPASTIASDSSFSWNMVPRSEQNQQAPRQRRSLSPHSTAISAPIAATNNNNGGGDFEFITGTNLAELKSKKQMTKVRKRAMRAYLEGGEKGAKKPRNEGLAREDSASSHASIASQDASAINIAGQQSVDSHTTGGRTGGSASSTRQSIGPQHRQHTSSPEAQRSRSQGTLEGMFETALIITPPREHDQGMPLPYDRLRTPLFVSFGEGVDPFKTMFQSSYPRVSVERLKFLCARFFGTYAMGQHWIPTVLSAPHTFLSTLCCASAHLDAILERDIESVETSSLRQELIHLIGQNLVHPGKEVGDLNITALIQLIVSEVIGREDFSLNINSAGLEKMIELRGGLNRLGMNGYLASTCSWVMLESAILREKSPQALYSDYCASRTIKDYPRTAKIPESPIYRPRTQFETLRKSKSYSKDLLALLEDIQAMIELFLRQSKPSHREPRTLLSLYNDITVKYRPISELRGPNDRTKNDFRYEAVRIAAVLQATAIIRRIPLSKALPHAANTMSTQLESLYLFSAASRLNDTPGSPTSPMNMRHDSMTGLTTSPPYAATVASSYFEDLRSSVSSAPPRSSVSSSVSYPHFPSITTSHSSIESSLSPIASRPYHAYSHDSNPFRQFSAAAPAPNASTTLLKDLKVVLESSNLSECWQDMAGVLLWVALTFGAASHDNDSMMLKKWYSALSMRASVLLCFEHPEAIHCTMLKMGRMVEMLGAPDASSTTGEKRRKTAA